MQVRPAVLFAALLIALLCMATASMAQGPYTMTARTEYNSPEFWTAPAMSMSVTVVVRDGNGNAVSGIPVTYTVDNDTAGWSPSSQTVTTNSCGQSSLSFSAPHDGQGTLHARYYKLTFVGPPLYWMPVLQCETSVDLTCSTGNARSDSGADPVDQNWGKVVPSFGILWVSTSAFTEEIATGASTWSTTNKASFSQGTLEDAYRVLCQDSCDSMFQFLAATRKEPGGLYTITFYTNQLDPCPTGSCAGIFPPHGFRHHIVSTAAHEFGHVLGLDHTDGGVLTGNDMAALMWSNTYKWFRYGTASPMTDEVNGLIALGY